MTNEKLIEEAAAAAQEATRQKHRPTWRKLPEYVKDNYRVHARAALAVFEKAHEKYLEREDDEYGAVVEQLEAAETPRTPPDDEREARDWAMDAAWGFREVTRPAAEKRNAHYWFDAGWDAAAGFRRTEVPEPSAACPKCGVRVTDQTPSTFYMHHDETCGGPLEEPQDDVVVTLTPDAVEANREYIQRTQDEPSDAQVAAAMREASRRSLMWRTSSDVKAVLRAALTVGEVR